MPAFFAPGAAANAPQPKVEALVGDEVATEPPISRAAVAPPGASKTPVGLNMDEITPHYSDAGEEDFESLGELLVYLRQTYGERIQHNGAFLPHITLAAQSVATFLNDHDYSMTSGSYSLLEQGKTLPKNPERFLDTISTCLAVPPSSKYWPLLRFQYMYDHARRYVNKEFAEEHCPPAKMLELLRTGKL